MNSRRFQTALVEKDLPEIETLIPAAHKTGDVTDLIFKDKDTSVVRRAFASPSESWKYHLHTGQAVPGTGNKSGNGKNMAGKGCERTIAPLIQSHRLQKWIKMGAQLS